MTSRNQREGRYAGRNHAHIIELASGYKRVKRYHLRVHPGDKLPPLKLRTKWLNTY